MKILTDRVNLLVQRARFSHGFTIKSVLLPGSILLPIFWTAVVNAGASANMTFTGSVVNRTCTPGWNDTVTVPFNSVDRSHLPAHGTISINKEFTLSLTNCSSDVSNVKVTASGTVDPADTNMWANSLDSGATGVGMYLQAEVDGGATPLMADGRGHATFPVSSGAVDMKFLAYLEVDNDAGKVTEGELNVPVTLNINYE